MNRREGMDLHRLNLGIKRFVATLEQLIIDLLATYSINATTKTTAPGVYIEDNKICSIGLKVSRGCTYHGIALNVAMNIEPFNRINPCGFSGLTMVQIRDFIPTVTIADVQARFQQQLTTAFE